MLLPKEIKGKNRIRDLKICELYLSGMTPNEIWDTFRHRQVIISLRRIHGILSDNASFINPRMGWTKSKRVHHLQRMVNKAGTSLAKHKDASDILKEIRTELDGEKSLVDQSTHYHITQLNDQQLIERARATGIGIPPGIEGRIGQANLPQPN